MTYEQLALEWLETRKTGHNSLRESTIVTYQTAISTITQGFSDIGLYTNDITDITAEKINRLLDHFSDFAKETLIGYTKVISQPLNFAVRKGYLAENPYKDILIPGDSEPAEVETFSADEIDRLLNLQVPADIHDMMMLAYHTGMRIGEILALRWCDVNFADNYIHVQRTLSYYRNKDNYTITEGKTRNSRRKIAFDAVTCDMLRRRAEKHTHDWVFCRSDGRIYSRQAIKMSQLCKAADIPPRSFHAFRHTHATMLLLAGVNPRIVQRRLGHASLSTTENTYCHVPLSMQQLAVDVLNNIGDRQD